MPNPNSTSVARRSLALLLALNFLCYMDRYILSAVEPFVRDTFFANEDPALAMAKVGSLATAFLISYMLLSPIFGWLADRYSRWVIIAIGTLVWSLATAASGWAPVFAVLVIARILVGTGEAAYGPASPTILADLFPPERRGVILAWFFAAIPCGSAIGYVVGGYFSSGAFGWRTPFYYAAVPGLILAGICLLMKDPRREARERAPKLTKADYLGLLRIPSFKYNVAAQTAMTFAIGGISFWAPSYFYNDRYHGLMKMEKISLIFGGITAVAGLVSTLFGGWLGDRMAKKYDGAYFYVSGCGILLAFPSTLAMLYAPFPWAWVFCFLAVFFLFFNIGPSNTAITNIVSPRVQSSAFAVNILIIHTFGDAISPPLIGAIGGRWGLSVGFIVVSLTMLVAGVLWLLGARHLGNDARKIASLPALG